MMFQGGDKAGDYIRGATRRGFVQQPEPRGAAQRGREEIINGIKKNRDPLEPRAQVDAGLAPRAPDESRAIITLAIVVGQAEGRAEPGTREAYDGGALS
jgi:hypothetical protein